MKSAAERLRELLVKPGIIVAPGCFDAMSAKLIERAGFSAAFMSGNAVSAARVGMPDTGLVTYSEMVDQGRNICGAVSIPVIGDGDTGYGNALNVKRTVRGYADAGFACIMIEDQVAPKRCGHEGGKQTVSRKEAFTRVQAAVDARSEGADILIMARTDANGTEGFEEAILRAQGFMELGADITFLEAPQSEAEIRAYGERVAGPKMANMVEQGNTPLLEAARLEELGYKIVIYPLTLILAGIKAMEHALAEIKRDKHPSDLAELSQLRDIVGFPAYNEAEKKYAID